MAEVYTTTFQLRRGLAATWAKVNPILAYGEPGFEKDAYRLKIGDGETAWNDLGYLGDGEYSISADNKSVEIKNNVLALYGFGNAAAGQIPSKSKEGNLEWIDRDEPISEAEILEIIGEGA